MNQKTECEIPHETFRTERCWRCGGYGTVKCSTGEDPSGYKKCPACYGTGYGETIEQYRARVIKPFLRKPK